jgi:transcriptional regulator with XRE-family HTH domain
MSVKNRIAYRRKELELTQTELAQRAGLKPPAISQYESGARNPSYEALIKLSNALNVSTDYLISGSNKISDNFIDQKSEFIMKIVNSMSSQDKDKVIEYATFIARGLKLEENNFRSNALQYSDLILDTYSNRQLPIDVYEIANKLGIKVVEDNLQGEAEAILFNGETKIILIDKDKNTESKSKYTVASLIGHAVIPWHLKDTYYSRKSGNSTLLTEDTEEMEARTFGAALIMPSGELEKDFSSTKTSLYNLKQLADQKYQVSLFALCNRLVEYDTDNYAIIQSSENKINKTFPGKRALKEVGASLDKMSKASSFFEDNSYEEEIREGKVPATCWLIDAKEGEFIFESSSFHPKYGVLTLLTMKKV